MSESYTVVAPHDIIFDEVQYMLLPNGMVDVWLRKNIRSETRVDESSNDEYIVNCADELYFQIDSSLASEQDIRDNFNKYWYIGEHWVDESKLTDAERMANLERENNMLREYIIELNSLL